MDQRPCAGRRRRDHRRRDHRSRSGARDLRSTVSVQASTDHPAPSSQPNGATELSDLREVFATGRTRGLRWRLSQLEAIERLCDEREADIAAALHADLGRPTVEAWLGDVASTKGEAAFARKHLKKWMRRRRQPLPLAQL